MQKLKDLAYQYQIQKSIEQLDNKNVFYSPFSLYLALMMTYEGAREKTAAEMNNFFNFGQNQQIRLEKVQKQLEKFQKANQKYEFNIANALWWNQNAKPVQQFQTIIEAVFFGTSQILNFADSVGSAKTINDWVEKKTKEKIKNLISPQSLNSLVELVITNAIYFKGKWISKFEKNNTKEEDFYVTSNQVVKVEMMHQTSKFLFYQNNQVQIARLDYEGNEIAMIVVLPQKNTNIKKIENNLQNYLQQFQDNKKNYKLRLALPKFKVETAYQFKSIFESLNVKIMFSELANFSGLSQAPVKVSEVIQKCFCEVDEEGTEAAAATAVIMELKCASVKKEDIIDFICNHPFYFQIVNLKDNEILFMGKLTNSDKSVENIQNSPQNLCAPAKYMPQNNLAYYYYSIQKHEQRQNVLYLNDEIQILVKFKESKLKNTCPQNHKLQVVQNQKTQCTVCKSQKSQNCISCNNCQLVQPECFFCFKYRTDRDLEWEFIKNIVEPNNYFHYCEQGHYLELVDSNYDTKNNVTRNCDLCKTKKIYYSFRCIKCDYDECLSCYQTNLKQDLQKKLSIEQQGQHYCQNGHVLTGKSVKDDIDNQVTRSCDKCKKKYCQFTYRCEQCDYDECLDCLSKI